MAVPNAVTQGAGYGVHILEPGASDMSAIVVPDDIIHHILEYAEVLDIIRARLVRQQTPFLLQSKSDIPQTARRVCGVIDASYELAIQIRLFSLGIPMAFRYRSGLYLMDLPCQLARLDQIAEAWQVLRPTTQIRLQDFDFVQYFDPQGNIQDHSLFSILMILHYRLPRLIGRRIVMREHWTLVNGQCLVDALEIVRLPPDSQSGSDEVDTLLGLHEEPRRLMSLGCSVLSTAVNLSTRLLAMLTSEG